MKNKSELFDHLAWASMVGCLLAVCFQLEPLANILGVVSVACIILPQVVYAWRRGYVKAAAIGLIVNLIVLGIGFCLILRFFHDPGKSTTSQVVGAAITIFLMGLTTLIVSKRLKRLT